MVICISFGNLNKYFIYILLSVIFHIFNESLYGFNYHESFIDVKLFNTSTQDYFSWHNLIHQIFGYIGTFIIAFFFNKYEIKVSKRERRKSFSNSPNQEKQNIQITLIHNDDENSNISNCTIIICLFIIFLWIIEEQLIDTYGLALKDLDFWMLELLILTAFSINMFKIEIYSHQKCAMWFCIFPCLLKIATIILSFFENRGERNKLLYIDNKLYIPIGISIYLILITSRSYVNSKIKWFMDLKYISPSRLLIYYGIMGTIICSIICLITTNIKCEDVMTGNDIFDYICKVPYNGTDKKFEYTERYFESYKFYIDTFRGKINYQYSYKEVIYEIIIIFLGAISFFLYKYFSMLVIQYLTPVYLILSNSMYFLIQKLIILIYNYILFDEFKKIKITSFILIKWILDTIGDIFCIIGFLVYLEIIELNFYDYDYNLKINISRRSFGESYGINQSEKQIINEEEEQEEEDSGGDFTLDDA